MKRVTTRKHFAIFDNMVSAQPPLTHIVAATAKNGIGRNGGLPWPMLKKEMAYFARVTKRVPSSFERKGGNSELQNVVVMGRKTWESIPPKFRPLKDRTNLIISRQSVDAFGPPHQDVVVASSIEKGLHALSARSSDSTLKPSGRVFIIGGGSIYDAALKLPNEQNILLTRVFNHYDCDTDFPIDLDGAEEQNRVWSRRSHEQLQDFVGEQLNDGDVEEKAGDEVVKFRYFLYQKKA